MAIFNTVFFKKCNGVWSEPLKVGRVEIKKNVLQETDNSLISSCGGDLTLDENVAGIINKAVGKRELAELLETRIFTLEHLVNYCSYYSNWS